MPDQVQPEGRYGHAVVRLEHYILVFGGAWFEGGITIRTIIWPQSRIWIYNLYTEQWSQHVISGNKKAPTNSCSACAVVIESNIYTFGGKMRESNELWKLSRTAEMCFIWQQIVTTNKMERPSPRRHPVGWEYSENLWIFGGIGPSPVGYLNDNGDYHVSVNNQLLCFNPSGNEWRNPKCSGSVPTPRMFHSAATTKHKTYFYGGTHTFPVLCDDLYELDMISLTWTLIQTAQPKPQGLHACSLNVTSDNKLILHGGLAAYSGPSPRNQFQILNNTWIFDLTTHTWRQYSSRKDHSRGHHTGTTGIDGCVIMIGGMKNFFEGYKDYTTTFHVMLEPKSLQKLAIQTIFNHKDMLTWKCLPKMLQRYLA